MRLFMLCEAMRWNHLPVAGGLYDQHPALLSAWMVIFEEKSKYEAEEHQKQQRELAKSKAGKR